MPIEVGKGSECERVPHNDVAFFSAAGNEPMLGRVDEGVHSLLMQVEGLILLIRKILYVVNMDEAIQR